MIITLEQVLVWLVQHKTDVETDVRELMIVAEAIRSLFAHPSVAAATQAAFSAANVAADAYEQIKLGRKESP